MSSQPPGAPPPTPKPFYLNQYYLRYSSVGPADGDLERSHSSGAEGPSHPVARRQSPKGAPEDLITLSAWGAVSQWYVGSMEWGHQVATQQRQTQDDGTSTHGCRAQDENYKGATCSRGVQKSILLQQRPRPRPTSKHISTWKFGHPGMNTKVLWSL